MRYNSYLCSSIFDSDVKYTRSALYSICIPYPNPFHVLYVPLCSFSLCCNVADACMHSVPGPCCIL